MTFLVAPSACIAIKPVSGGPPRARGERPSYGGTLANTKYSALDQIRGDNVRQLRSAWRWKSPDHAIMDGNPRIATFVNEGTPIMIDGVLYVSTALSQVAALDAVTGRTLWVQDPKIYEHGTPANRGFLHRGVAYWSDGSQARILIGTGRRAVRGQRRRHLRKRPSERCIRAPGTIWTKR